MKPGVVNQSIISLVFVGLIVPWLFWHCSQKASMEGKYTAQAIGESGRLAVTLELHPDGKGFWSTQTDNTPFRWDVYNNRLRLHTPTGGVIEGALGPDHIKIALPGTDVIYFTRNK